MPLQTLKTLLFGRPTERYVSGVGTFKTHVRKNSTKTDYIWASNVSIGPYREVYVIVDGDRNAPAAHLVAELEAIGKSFDTLLERIATYRRSHPELGKANQSSQLTVIMPNDPGYFLELEQPDGQSIFLTVEGDRVTEISHG